MGSGFRVTSGCFHSTKEGFKAILPDEPTRRRSSFHSTKEGFKGRHLDQDSTPISGFHSTKEGFKAMLPWEGKQA